MKEYIKSNTTGKVYCPSDVIRIVNLRQLAKYLSLGIELLDIYPGKDFKTGEPILVGIVNKKDSYQAYQDWMGYKND